MKLKYFNKYIYSFLFLLAIALPSFTLAFSLSSSSFAGILTEATEIINVYLIPILSSLAFIVFFWGVSKFILHSDNKADIENGRNYMIWGIGALFILLTFRVIIGLISVELEVPGQNPPNEGGILLREG